MNASITIPFNRPSFAGKEKEYISESISMRHVSGDGFFTKKCNEIIRSSLGASKVLLTTSCTHALEMSALLLNIKEGDEIILPSFTFVSTANAFVLRGAKPIFADVDLKTLNISPQSIEQRITKRTKAIVPVHYGGVGCEMTEIVKLADSCNIAIVEDNAHGLFGKFKNKPLGTFGALATQSFHETKNFHCGEGGALIINSEEFIDRAEIIREKGTDRSRFFRGQVDKYTWVDIGSSYLPSEILAAFLYAQLENKEAIQQRRRTAWERYNTELKDWAALNRIGLPFIPDHCEQTHHVFYLIMPTLEDRQAFIDHLRKQSILAVYHYLPLHLSEMGKTFGGKLGDCPNTERLSDQLVRLPLFNDITDDEQDKVISAVCTYRTKPSLSLNY